LKLKIQAGTDKLKPGRRRKKAGKRIKTYLPKSLRAWYL
jgi:hypothetical protein